MFCVVPTKRILWYSAWVAVALTPDERDVVQFTNPFWCPWMLFPVFNVSLIVQNITYHFLPTGATGLNVLHALPHLMIRGSKCYIYPDFTEEELDRLGRLFNSHWLVSAWAGSKTTCLVPVSQLFLFHYNSHWFWRITFRVESHYKLSACLHLFQTLKSPFFDLNLSPLF